MHQSAAIAPKPYLEPSRITSDEGQQEADVLTARSYSDLAAIALAGQDRPWLAVDGIAYKTRSFFDLNTIYSVIYGRSNGNGIIIAYQFRPEERIRDGPNFMCYVEERIDGRLTGSAGAVSISRLTHNQLPVVRLFDGKAPIGELDLTDKFIRETSNAHYWDILQETIR